MSLTFHESAHPDDIREGIVGHLSDAKGRYVAQIGGDEMAREEALEYARLFAEAEEMYGAIRHFLDATNTQAWADAFESNPAAYPSYAALHAILSRIDNPDTDAP